MSNILPKSSHAKKKPSPARPDLLISSSRISQVGQGQFVVCACVCVHARMLNKRNMGLSMFKGWRCSSVGRVLNRHAADKIQFPCVARDCSPTVNFQCRLSYSACIPLCAVACINICVHGKDPAVHVRARWIIKTLKHPLCMVDWVA